MKKYNKDTKLSELMGNEETICVLARFNVPCLSCAFARAEMQQLKIGDVCGMYGINLTDLIEALNDGINKNKKLKKNKR